MEDGNQILAFGLAAIGLVLGAGLGLEDGLLATLVLGFFLPVLAALVLSIWFAAQERIARASHYLSGVETRLKSSFTSSETVSWEAWLRAPKRGRQSEHFWSTEHAGFALFGLIIACSATIGWTAGVEALGRETTALMVITSLALSAGMFINVLLRYRRWKRWLSTHYDPATWPGTP